MTMTQSERADFRGFCQLASDTQLLNIVAKERGAAEGGDEYRVACAAIAEAVASERGLLLEG